MNGRGPAHRDGPAVDQPRYLSPASAEFPDTAAEAVRNETLRVYNAATRIIIDGLGIARPASDGSMPAGAPRRDSNVVVERDIDAQYEKHIKVLYSAIVAFISETAFARREEQVASLQWLREANAHIVEAVKDTKHLQKNLLPYVKSSNVDIRRCYEQLRDDIASTLGSLQTLEHDAGGVMDMKDFVRCQGAWHAERCPEHVAR